jgi:uncharacterized protein involved in exopolysaccharide biosynthesis
MSEFSDQEIDLRPYVTAVIDKWYWILAAGIVAALLGFLISSLLAPTYEATAVVAITAPSQKLQFDPRIQTLSDTQPLKAYPELAKSDELLGDLRDSLSSKHEFTLVELRSGLEAKPGDDPTIIKLTASNNDPKIAAELANTWAELFVSWANQIYGNQGDEQLLFFEEQLVEAANKLEAAQQALIDFQAYNRSGILENELLALQQTQADYLAKQRQTDLILQDIESLLAQAEDNGASTPSNINELASLLLQVRALGGVANSVESTMPWQIQLNVGSQAGLAEPADQQAVLSDLKETLQAQSKQLEARLADLEPQLFSVQQEWQEANAEYLRLTRNFTVAEETYTTLARTVDEKRISSQDTTTGLKLASKTAVPEYPSGPRKTVVAIGAGLAGATLAVLSILLVLWWRGD